MDLFIFVRIKLLLIAKFLLLLFLNVFMPLMLLWYRICIRRIERNNCLKKVILRDRLLEYINI